MKYVALAAIVAVVAGGGILIWRGQGTSESMAKVACGGFSLELIRKDVPLNGETQSSFKVYYETDGIFSPKKVVDVAFLGEGESAQFALLKSNGSRKEDAIKYHGNVLDIFTPEEYSRIYECVDKNPDLIKLR